MSPPSASASISVSAPPETVYELVTGVTDMSGWNVECESAEWVGPIRGPRPGARFRGHNRNGRRRWSTLCTVTVADPHRVFAYGVRAGGLLDVAIWRFEITPSETGCHVEQSTWDTRGPVMRLLGGLVSGVRDRAAHNRANMLRTLERLKAAAEAAAPPSTGG
ncbi:SRPBCC family protein [Streptosporangium sp. NPDC004379]|uniref:SRPBCC family protein n=1 Tax=Streptosporangium sp. NPDC004379 TaxID=3366189 RepID=UPI0036BFAE64